MITTLKEYIVQKGLPLGSRDTGGWLTPPGKYIDLGTKKHITDICESPKKYGFTEKDIIDAYNGDESKIGLEINGRKSLILSLLKKGWIRIRNNREFLSIELWGWNKRKENILNKWLYNQKKYSVKSARVVDVKTMEKVNLFEEQEILNESSLNRMISHFKKRGYPVAIITAFRSENDEKKNVENNKKLASRIKSKGFSYVFVDGGGQRH